MLNQQICPACCNPIEDGEQRHFFWDDVDQRSIRICGDPECAKKMARMTFQRRKAAKAEKASLIKG